MKKLLIASSSLASLSLAGFAGAVDVTLGGSIEMGVEFGLGKTHAGLSATGGRNEVTLSISAAHTTDGGLAFGGRFALAASAEIEFDPYTNAAGEKSAVRMTVDGRTKITGNFWNVSGGSSLSAAKVVAVKINSDWLEVDAEQEELFLPLGAFTSSNICMLAGRGRAVGEIFSDVPGQFTDAPFPIYMDLGLAPAKGEYLPAGQVLSVQVGSTLSTGNPSYTFQMRGQTGPNKSLTLDVSTTRGAGAVFTDGRGFNLNTSTSVRSVVVSSPSAPKSSTKGSSTFPVTAAEKFAVDIDGDGVAEVFSAAVFAAPYMMVKMASSETKMVIGAACLDGLEASETAFFMNNASKIASASDASIYIEGGFGKLTLQSSDATGGVAAIAGAGDRADIDATGLVVVAEGYGLLGATPFIAFDLGESNRLGELEIITGGRFDLGALSASFDVALDNPADVLGISAWDLGGTFAMGDLTLGFATDSSSDWGLSAAMDIAGFGVSTIFGSSSSGDHEKSGITYSVALTAALDGYALAIGFDEALQPTIGVEYDLGGLTLYANYDAGDEGGNLGASLSF